MKNFVSPHVHVQSLDSASTVDRMAGREVELETGYMTVTDHGSLEATRAVYDLCGKGGKYAGKLKPILGMEAYFRDDEDPILHAAGIEQQTDPDGHKHFREYFKYCHITLHSMDEASFFKMTKLLSDADFRAEKHGSERKPLFGWSQLEQLGALNTTGTSGCLIGMVGRHLMQNNDPTMARKFYERTRACFKPGNFYVEVFPHTTDKNWSSEVVAYYEDGTRESFQDWKKIKTHGGELKAADLAEAFKRSDTKARKDHRQILAVMNQRKWEEREPKNVLTVEKHEGFIHNECRPWCSHGDYQLEVNKFVVDLAKEHGDTILISDDSHFARPEEKILQDIRLMQHGGSWRFSESHHRMSTAEARLYFNQKLGIKDSQFEGWVENTHNWASRFKDFKFTTRPALPTKFYPEDTLKHTMELVKSHGRMDWKDMERVKRLKAEIDLLHSNGTIDLLPYFFIDEEVCRLYRDNGELTGPGRGSAAGLSLSYYLGITHADPIRYGLSMDRFLTLDRVQSLKMPDIDQDLPHRDLLEDPVNSTKGFLREKFGEHYARISTNVLIKLKSAIKDVHRVKDGFVSEEIEVLTKKLPDPLQGIESSDFVFGYKDPSTGAWTPGLVETNPVLQKYMKDYPEHWNIVKMALGMSRQKSQHACAYVFANQPIDTFIPLTTVGDDEVRVTQFTGPMVEAAGGLKMDFLVINSLKDIGNAIRLIQNRVDKPAVKQLIIDGKAVPDIRCVPINGRFYDIWDLPDDPAVYNDICLGNVETVFQLDAPAARQGLRNFKPHEGILPIGNIEGLSAFTALDRPGPLDAMIEMPDGSQHNMLIEFANRARGAARGLSLDVLDQMLPETHGVIVFQEQLENIFKTVGESTGTEATNFRQRIGKKKLVEVQKIDRPIFMKGAVKQLGEEDATRLWDMMETFGQYGFNKSHSVCYSITAFACAWLKHYYPLEWWTSVLRNADRNDVNEKFWRYVSGMVELPDIRHSTDTFVIQGEKIRAPMWLINGIGEKANNILMANRPYKNIEDLLQKILDHRTRNATVVTKEDGTTKLKLAHSALNDSILRKLIICDALNGLFPDVDESSLELTTVDRLRMFEEAAAKVRGKKLKKSTASQFNLQSRHIRFQLRKDIMPAYSEALLPIMMQIKPERFGVAGKLSYYTDDDKEQYGIVTGKQFEWLQSLDILPPNITRISVPAYVVEQRKFRYKSNSREACGLKIDVDGHRMEHVKWAGTKTLPPAFQQDLNGALVMLTFVRYNSDSNFFFHGVEVIAPPLTKEQTKEESS